jgi:hypothetical protein
VLFDLRAAMVIVCEECNWTCGSQDELKAHEDSGKCCELDPEARVTTMKMMEDRELAEARGETFTDWPSVRRGDYSSHAAFLKACGYGEELCRVGTYEKRTRGQSGKKRGGRAKQATKTRQSSPKAADDSANSVHEETDEKRTRGQCGKKRGRSAKEATKTRKASSKAANSVHEEPSSGIDDPALSCMKCGAEFKYKKNASKHMRLELCGKKRGRSAAGKTQRKSSRTAANGVRNVPLPLSRFRVRSI